MNLFIHRKGTDTLAVISEGLSSFITNANRLIEDVEILLDSKRQASAVFLLATADEEMAKSFILLDMCRLDFSRHDNVLRALCRVFYDHVMKHAYNSVARFPREFRDMAHVKELWDVEINRWWPSSDIESGIPDMPHETYFTREMPLYVEFVDADQKWHIADTIGYSIYFEDMFGSNVVSKSKAALDRLRETADAGLYKPECLFILNETFRGKYIKEDTSTEEIIHLHATTAIRIQAEIGIPKERFFGSALDEWPVYHLVVNSRGSNKRD